MQKIPIEIKLADIIKQKARIQQQGKRTVCTINIPNEIINSWDIKHRDNIVLAILENNKQTSKRCDEE